MNKPRLMATAATLALSLAATGSLVRADDAAGDAASNHSTALKGTYSYFSGGDDAGYYPSVGTFTFDGKGGLTGVVDMNADGTVCVGMALNGTYALQADRRTGTAALTLTSVNTDNCGNYGDSDTLDLILSFGPRMRTFNFVEMDQFVSRTFENNFETFVGTATRR